MSDFTSSPLNKRTGWNIALGLGALAALVRLPNLGSPHAFVFDETYYAKDALGLINFGYERKLVDDASEKILTSNGHNLTDLFLAEPSYIVHPPFGKWVIGTGEAIFGATPFGWRIMMALLGIASVVLIARIARRLFQSEFAGFVAGLLLAVDAFTIAMSRTALLDNTLAFLILVAFWLVIYDRDMRDANSTYPRWTRPVLAITLGLALATKWSAVYYAVVFVLLILVWDFKRRAGNATTPRASVLTWLRKDVLPALHMPFLAIAVYLASWVGWFASSDAWNRNWAADHPATGLMRFVPDALRSLLDYHVGMLSFHTNLDSPHSYQANPWSWPFMIRPTSFFYESNPTCGATQCAQEVIPLGNPAIWWVGVIALLALALTAIKFGNRNASAIVLAFAAGWVPWLFFTHRTVFTFYSIVFIPFTVLAIAIVADTYRRSGRTLRIGRFQISAGVLGYLLIVVALAIFFYPVAVGQSIPYDSWHLRMWLPSWV